MAVTQDQIPSDMLRPGDMVDIEYIIRGGNETLLNLAISAVKNSIASDERFNYQGSREVAASELATGRPVRFLIITVQVRKTAKQERIEEMQQASVGAGLVAVAVALGLVAGALYFYSGVLAYSKYTIRRNFVETVAEVERIRTDPNLSEQERIAALQAVGAAAADRPSGATVGGGLAAFGGSIVTAAIIIGVLWALSLSGRPRGGAGGED